MRFVEDGPSIFDELLHARDEGRVVFFCGAGVSQARARLPDFFGLAESVLAQLGASQGSDAYKVLRKASEEKAFPGLISVDQVFSFIEREFMPQDILSAVARSLAPPKDVDRSAHEVLLRLARAPNGNTQLVTTNFDRLFESNVADLHVYQPPHLPYLSRYDVLDGIVYLHGCVNHSYTHADGLSLVLSGADFGHAYLSEGWATDFVREIFRNYVVVFIGYSANDPPVRYLLEGLKRDGTLSTGIYAFQSRRSEEQIDEWQPKGVRAIPYALTDRGHSALWDTLELWAARADDPKKWQSSVLTKAMAGPTQLKPHERGQVAHLVATSAGAQAFASAKPPAEWLCVFDPSCRYERPGKLDWTDPESPVVDPFSFYGLDSDPAPQRDEDSYAGGRSTPSEAWDAFVMDKADVQNVSPINFAMLRGPQSLRLPSLPVRLSHLVAWFAEVVDQPAAIWWAIRQNALHPSLRWRVEWELSRRHVSLDSGLAKAWHCVREAWANMDEDRQQDWHDLDADIRQSGWSVSKTWRLVDLSRPYLDIQPSWKSRPMPPRLVSEYHVSDFVTVTVRCFVPELIEVPENWLAIVVRGVRGSIDAAIHLCKEVGDLEYHLLAPIATDSRPEIIRRHRPRGLSGCMIWYTQLFERLLETSPARAREEYNAWPANDDSVFARLRIWAGGKSTLVKPHGFAKTIRRLSDGIFWGNHHQRDLLLSLASRWNELSDRDKSQIESRLLQGPKQRKDEEDGVFSGRQARQVLQRIQWLFTQGCNFSCDINAEIEARQVIVPDWKPEFAKDAAQSLGPRAAFVAIDKQFEQLLREPLKSLLSKAHDLSGRSETDAFKQLDPFAGLCTAQPRRAYLALAHAAKNNDFPLWAWERFLDPSARDKDRARFAATIGSRLCRLPETVLVDVLQPAASWFEKVANVLSIECPHVFDCMRGKLTDILVKRPELGTVEVLRSDSHRDWFTEAINSPIGNVVQAIVNDARLKVPSPEAARRSQRAIEKCLALPGDSRQYSISLAALQLDWLYGLDSNWTEQNLLSILDGESDDDRYAFWAGFFYSSRISYPQMFFRMKRALLDLVKDKSAPFESHSAPLANLILRRWIWTDEDKDIRFIENAEFRDALLQGDDEFRSHVISSLEHGMHPSNQDPKDRDYLRGRVRRFFEEVWPLQRVVRTSQMTVRLFELAVSHLETFTSLSDVVSPLLTRISDEGARSIHVRAEVEELAHANPERLLDLLHRVLPSDVHGWPWGIKNALQAIVDADPKLATDLRLLNLRRQWDEQ